MSEFAKIDNMKDIQKEKGIYYPYLIQMMGAKVIDGVLIIDTDLKRFPYQYVEGLFQSLSGIIRIRDSSKVFPTISKEAFKYSVMWALTDLFNDGCEIKGGDLVWDKCFKFLDKSKYADILVD